MRGFKGFLFIFLVGFSLGIVKSEIVDRIVAVVGSEVITQSELERAYKLDELGVIGLGVGGELSKREYLEKMVEKKLITQEVRKQGTTVSSEEIEKEIERKRRSLGLTQEGLEAELKRQGLSMEKYREMVRDNLAMGKLISKEVQGVEITDQEIQSYYQLHQEQFHNPFRVHLYQIVIKEGPEAKARIKQVKEKFKAGVKFSELVKIFSAVGKEEEGDLGWMVLGSLKPELREVISEMELGGLSQVYKDGAGYHIFWLSGWECWVNIPGEEEAGVMETRVAQSVSGLRCEIKNRSIMVEGKELLVPVEDCVLDVGGMIRNYLYQKQMEERYQVWIEKLKAKSYIEIRL